MNLSIQIVIGWFLLDIAIVSTLWYVVSTIRPLCPDWWKVHICDELPADYQLDYPQMKTLTTTNLPIISTKK